MATEEELYNSLIGSINPENLTSDELLRSIVRPLNTNSLELGELDNEVPRIYDADTGYLGDEGYRVQGIDTPEMPSYQEKLYRLEQAKKSPTGEHISLANAGERAKLEAQIAELGPNALTDKLMFEGQKTRFDDRLASPLQTTESEYQKEDIYGRKLIDAPEYTTDMVSRGYAVPAFDKVEGNVEAAMEAKSKRLGLWSSAYDEMQKIADKRKTFKKLENEEFIRETIAGLDRGGLGLGELVDQMQSQALKFYADSSNALRKVSRESIRRSSRIIADLLDIPKESVDWVSLDRSIDETLPLNAKLLGFDHGIQEIRENITLRDQITGFSKKSRNEYNEAKREMLKNAENKKYGKLAWNVITFIPEFLADTIPEMSVLFLPGGAPTVIGTRLSNQMEEFKDNNNRDMTTGEAVETALAIASTIYAEKFIVGRSVKGVVKPKTLREGVVGTAGAAAGGSLQELSEKVQEDIYTGKVEDRRDLDAIIKSATDPEAVVSIASGGIVSGTLKGGAETIRGIAGKAKEVELPKTEEEKEIDEILKGEKTERTSKIEELESKLENTDSINIESVVKDLVTLESREDLTKTDLRRIKTMKSDLLKRLDDKEFNDEDIPVYGSEEEALAEIEELVVLGNEQSLSTNFDNNISKIAKKNNITDEQLQNIKDELAVEQEITEGKRGYRYYDRELTRLKARDTGTTSAQEKVEDKLINFKQSQVNRKAVLENAIESYKAKINDPNIEEKPKYKISTEVYKTVSGKPFEINKKDIERNLANPKSRTGVFKIIDNIDRTLEGINAVIDKHKVDKEVGKTKTPSEPVLDETPSSFTLEDTPLAIQEDKSSTNEKESKETLAKTIKSKLGNIDKIIKVGEKKLKAIQNKGDTEGKSLEIIDKLEALENKKKTIIEELGKSEVTNNILDNNRGIDINIKSKEYQQKMIDKDKTRVTEGQKAWFNLKMTSPVDARDVFELDSKSINLLSSLDINQLGKKVIKLSKENVTSISKAIPAWDKIKGKSGKSIPEHMIADSNPSRVLIFNKDGSINETVATAVGIAKAELLGIYSDSLRPKNNSELARMLGLQEFEVKADIVKFFRDKGNYQKNVAEQLGKTVISSLGLKKNKNIDEQISAKMIADLGRVAMETLIKEGYLELVKTDLIEHNRLLNIETDKTDVKEFNMVRLTDKGKMSIKDNKKLYEDMVDTLSIEVDSIKAPRTRFKKEKKVKVRNNNITESGEKVTDIINNLNKQKFTTNIKILDYILDNKEAIKQYMGYTEDYSNMTYEGRESQKAKNDAIERSIEHLEEIKDEGMAEMYFDWFYSKNGRYFIDSVTVNPQTDKLHRFLFTPKEHTTTIDMNKEENAIAYKYAIAQSFGVSIDKKNNDTVIGIADKILGIKNKVGFIENLKSVMYKKGSIEEIESLINEELNTEVEIEHISHLLQGMESLLDYYYSEGKPFKTTISAEYDGVTNGFAIRLMQMPTIDNVWEWLNRVGIFKKDEQPESMNTWLSQKENFDSYQTLAKEMKNYKDKYSGKWEDSYGMWDTIEPLLPKVEGKEISNSLRSLFKDPFMTFNYGAGMSSIRRSLSYNIVNSLMEKALINEEGKYEKFRKSLWKNIVSKSEYSKDKLDNWLKNTDFMNNKNVKVGLLNLVNESYGYRVEIIMSDKFMPYVLDNKSINESFRLMFQAYSKAYKKAIDSKVKEGIYITEEIKNDIILSLRDVFPMIKAPYGKDTSDGIPIYSTKVKGVDDRFRKVQTYLSDGSQSTVDIMIREFDEAHAAGAVIPIHFLDGKVLGDTILNKGKGTLPIHDAIMPSISNTFDKIRQYNENFIKSNRDYNLIQEVQNSLERAEKYSKKEKLGDISIEVKEGKFTKTVTIKDSISFIKILNKENIKDRDSLYSNELISMQMNGMPNSESVIDVKANTDEGKVDQGIGLSSEDTIGIPTKEKLANEYTNLGNAASFSTDKMIEVANELEATSGIKTNEKHSKHLDSLLNKIAENDWLREANIYMLDKAKKSRGWFIGKSIAIEVAKRKRVSNMEKSSKEVYVHELLHGISAYGLKSKNPNAQDSIRKITTLFNKARKQITWKDFLPDVSLDENLEVEEAKAMWNYVFNNKQGNGLEEFIAHGLSNESFMSALDRVKLKEDQTGKTFIEKMKYWFNRLIDTVFGRLDLRSQGARESLEKLVFELAEYNSNATKELEESKSLDDILFQGIGVLNDKASKALEKLSNSTLGEKLTEFPREGSNRSKILWLGKNLPRIVTNTEYKSILETVMYSAFPKAFAPEGFFFNVINDMTQPDKLARAVERLGLYSDNIDSRARSIETATKDGILGNFKTKLKKREQEALTNVVLDLDLHSLVGKYGNNGVHNLIKDTKLLNKEISNIEKELKEKDPKFYNWYIEQAKGLGYYLVTHQAGIAQNLNAYNIANRYMSEDVTIADENLINKIDKLSSLYGIKYTPKASKETVSKIIEKDSYGVNSIMRIHGNFKKESNSLFDTPVQKIKGYTKELFDDSIQLEIAPIKDKKRLESEGFSLVDIIKPSKDGIGVNKTMGVFQSKTNIRQAYNKGATRMTGMTKRGTSLFDSRYLDNPDTASKQARTDKKRMDILRDKIVKKMVSGEYTFNPEDTGQAPLMNDAGIVVDYRWMMSKDKKKKYLKQDTKVGKVLGRSYASIIDKTGTEEHNKKVLNLIEKDMKENYISGLETGKNGKVYIKIKKNSDNAFVQELYKIVPNTMKKAIENTDKKFIAVRRDMLHHYFGFRNFSVGDMKWMGYSPTVVKKLISYVEMIWQEIIKVAKVDIIIRIPFVLLGNIMSNLMYSVQMGTSPVKVAKLQIKNLRNVHDYLENHKLLEQLKVDKANGKKVDTKIKEQEKLLKRNPVSELMDEGLYQAIIEDVSKEDIDSNNRITQWIDNKTEDYPEWVKRGVHWAYISEKTSLYQFMTKATQYSDFVARVTEYQILRKKGVSKDEAINEVLDAFVNYNKVSSNFEQYFNDMGFVMFTKYAKRIQRAIAKGAVKHPVNFMVSFLGQEFTGVDIDDITDQSLFTKEWSNIWYNPVDNLMRAITPTLGEVAFDAVKR